MEVRRQFAEVYGLIQQARERTFRTVNSELIQLYWRVGKYISLRVEQEEWGKGVVKELAGYLKQEEPGIKGFSQQNLWRMKQFYEAYAEYGKLSPLVRELSWTNNMVILARTKSHLEREYYLRLSIQERYTKRSLERAINSSAFERSTIAEQKLSPMVRELNQGANSVFKDSYVLDFLDLPEEYSENDLQKAILSNLKDFILELGSDFTFIGEEYRIQVGKTDFFIDLLFYHRELQCLVPIELKIDKFQPEYMGKMNFYLEALDRDVKKPHENPSVGIILCKDKDDQVVEYALSRNMSPTLVAEYETKLIPKGKLKAKMEEIYALAEAEEDTSL